MSRMKAHWPERINPVLELRAAIYWLESDLGRCDLYRCLAICEAISIIQWCIDAILSESYQRAEKLREQFRHTPGLDDNPLSSGQL